VDSLSQRVLYRTVMRDLYANKDASEKLIRASRLAWTTAYPTALVNCPAISTYRAAEQIPMRGMPRISRAIVAAFLYQAARGREWIRRDAVITD
jgi:hypothetical protein